MTGETTRFYIGSDDCKVASCPSKQEFPEADCPYCCLHSLDNYLAEEVHRQR